MIIFDLFLRDQTPVAPHRQFQIQRNFAILWFFTYAADHQEMLHTPRQWHYRHVCKLSLWYISNHDIVFFNQILSSIEIPSVGSPISMLKAFF